MDQIFQEEWGKQEGAFKDHGKEGPFKEDWEVRGKCKSSVLELNKGVLMKRTWPAASDAAEKCKQVERTSTVQKCLTLKSCTTKGKRD